MIRWFFVFLFIFLSPIGDDSISYAEGGGYDGEVQKDRRSGGANKSKKRYRRSRYNSAFTAEMIRKYFAMLGPKDRAEREMIKQFQGLSNKYLRHPDVRGSEKAIERAFAFYIRNRNGIRCEGSKKGKPLKNWDWIIVNDFTKPSDQKRQFIINVKTGQVYSSGVAHGYGSNQPISKCPPDMRYTCKTGAGGTIQKCKIPVNFSDIPGSGTTTRGFHTTAEMYRSSKANFSAGNPPSTYGDNNAIRMDGLQRRVNSNARRRAVVLHRGPYAHSNGVRPCADSAGCPVMPPAMFEKLKEEIYGGALMYNHTIVEDRQEKPDC